MPALNSTTLSRRNLMHEMTSQENNAWSILAITGTWCFLALIIVLLRVYTRLTTIRYLGWDDIFAVITMIFGMVIWGCFIGESHSALGKHWQAITPEMMVPYSKWQFAHGMLMVWALHGMKIAFAIFLLRLSNGKIFRRSLFAVMCFMTIYTTASWLTLLLSCFPISASWNGRNAKCISLASFRGLGVTYSILGMLTDAFLAFIPVPIISRMQLNIRTKICLYLAFGMGLATVTCGAIKSYYLWHYFNDRDRLFYNSYFVWGALELYVGIIAACLVSLKPLISSFLEKAKSTLVTSAALAKSLHHHGSPTPHSPHPASPRFDEKTEQQFNTFNTQNFPRIQICSVSDYEMPNLPIMTEQPKIFRVEMESNDSPTSLSSYPSFTSAPKSKRKHRPAPLDTEALSRRTSLELPCLGGVLTSPSPTHLPSAVDLSFLDLVKGRDPETLSRSPSVVQLPNSRFSDSTTSTSSPATMTTANSLRSSLSVPNICGLLTSPSPTFLNSATGSDFEFFSLIRCRDPEALAAASKVAPSRRGTVISIPDSIPEDHGVNFPTSRRATLGHTRYHSVEISEASTASMQTVQRITAGEVRRRPSMAPSAASTSSAFFCPPIHVEDSQGTSMYFHVMTSGQFRSTAETAAKSLEVEEAPLSPMSSGPAPKLVLREQHEYFGFSPVFDGGFEDLAARERIDSSQAATLKKDK